MMRVASVIAVVALLIPLGSSDAGFLRTYDVTSYEDEARAVLEMPDGGFAFWRLSCDPGQQQQGLVYTDAAGNQTGLVPGLYPCLFQETDTTLVFVGFDEIVRTDLAGSILYSKPKAGSDPYMALGLAGGGFLACGGSYGENGGFLASYDQDWDCQWTVQFDGYDIRQLASSPDGTIAAVGEALPPGPSGGILAMVEPDGSIAGVQYLDDVELGAVAPMGSDFVIGGSNGITAITHQGDPIWTYQSSAGDYGPNYTDLAFRAGGQLVACGVSLYTEPSEYLGVATCLGPGGSLQWERLYPGFVPAGVIPTAGQELAFCGYSGPTGYMDDWMSVLMLTDGEGWWGSEGVDPSEGGASPVIEVLANPSQGVATLQVGPCAPGAVQVFVYDICGRLCWASGSIECGSGPMDLTVGGLRTGAYLAVLRAGGLQASARFAVVQ